MRPMAPNAFLRPCQSRARSAVFGGGAHLARARARGAGGSTTRVLGRHRSPAGRRAPRAAPPRRRWDSRRRRWTPRPPARRRWSIISSAAGTMPAAMMAETASLAARTLVKSASIVRTAAGIGSSRTVMAAGDAEHSLAADEEAHEVGAPRLAVRGAEPGERAVGQDDLELDDVIGGDAGLEAVRAAGVLGDVAADGARRLARRIGHVLQAERQDGVGEPGVDDAGLDHRAPAARGRRCRMRLRRVRVTSTASPPGERTARQPGAGAARHERHVGGVQAAHHRDQLVARAGKHHDARPRLVRREAVHGVRRQLGAAMPHPAGTDDALERRAHAVVHAPAVRSGG